MDIGRECRHQNTGITVTENIFQGHSHGTFRRSIALSLRIGGICHQQKDAFVTNFRKSVEIDGLTFQRRIVHLEVPCMEDLSDRSIDTKADGVSDGMGRTDSFHCKRTHFDLITGSDHL